MCVCGPYCKKGARCHGIECTVPYMYSTYGKAHVRLSKEVGKLSAGVDRTCSVQKGKGGARTFKLGQYILEIKENGERACGGEKIVYSCLHLSHERNDKPLRYSCVDGTRSCAKGEHSFGCGTVQLPGHRRKEH